MSEAVTLFASRWNPTDYITLQGERVVVGSIAADSRDSRWRIEPVADTSYVRFRNADHPESYLHIETGSPLGGAVGPAWLSAQWQFESVPDTAYVRILSRWPLTRWAHIESGSIDVGDVGPGWLSAQWNLETVPGTAFVRLRNRLRPDEALNIESGSLTAGPVGPGWLSAQWLVRRTSGTSFVRLQNRWKSDHYFHIESGRADAGPIGPAWLSAQWLLEPVSGTKFVRLRNRWDGARYLHVERGVLEAGVIDPVWLSAQWVSGALRTKSIPLPLFQRKFDEFVNNRERPLFKLRLHGEHYGRSELTTFVEDPITGNLERFGNPVDLGHLELGRLGNDYYFNDLNTERVRLTLKAEPGAPAAIEARIDFETKGEELKINNFPNVDFDGLHLTVNLRFALDELNGLVGLATHKDSVVADASVDAALLPDGATAGSIEDTLKSKVVEALDDRLRDQTDESIWQQWRSVSEGSSIPGAAVTAIATGNNRVALFVADARGGVYATSGNPTTGWRPWATVSEGSSTPGAPISAVSIGSGRIALFLADPHGGIYANSGSVEHGWGTWRPVSEGSSTPGAPITAVSIGSGRVVLFLADANGGIYANSGSIDDGWGPWRPVSQGSSTPGAPISAVSGAPGRIALFVADANGGIYTVVGHPTSGWGPWTSVSEGATTPGGAITAVPIGGDRVALFIADRNGGIYSTSGSAQVGWAGWTSVSDGSSTPGAAIGATPLGDDRTAVFVADPNGDIYATAPGGLRAGLNRRLTRLLLGGDFRVFDVRSDGRQLTLGYVASAGLEPFAENPQAPLDPGRLSNIDHIVVLMMENRSFDHMLGYLSKHGGRVDVDGLHGGESNSYAGRDYSSQPLPSTQFPVGPCHDHECVVTQVNAGKLDGFVADYAARAEKGGVDPGDVMGYYQAHQVPVYDVLAREFLLCQRWFCSHPGPTFPNRFYSLTARLNRDATGAFEANNPDFNNFSPVFTKTIFDHLSAQGVSWHYYEHGYCFLRLFEPYTFDDTAIIDARDPVNGFFAAAEAGTLPSVSFIDPDFIDVPPGNDDHPPTDIAHGQLLIAQIVRALVNSPLWSKTMLIITYDEHGGFYDHVPPPPAAPVSGIDRYGPRVPAVVVSPWVERGGVSNIVLDHTSILKTIARRFLSAKPPDLGERMVAANDLSMLMLTEPRSDRPDIPLPAVPQAFVGLRAAVDRRNEGHRDFHRVMQSYRYRFFVD